MSYKTLFIVFNFTILVMGQRVDVNGQIDYVFRGDESGLNHGHYLF